MFPSPFSPRFFRFAATSVCATCILLFAASVEAAESFTVDAERHGDAVQIDAHAIVHATLPLIHATLTDYDHLPDFIPGMRHSHLIEHHGQTSIVAQSGYARFWFLHFPIDVTVETIDRSPSSISVHLLKGNLRQLDGSYEVQDLGNGSSAVRWHGVIEPGTDVPSAIAVALLRKNISEQFRGMVDEIERRATQAPPMPG